MPFIEVKFSEIEEETIDIAIALLFQIQYEGFIEEPALLKAFIPGHLFNKDVLHEIAIQLNLKYTVTELPDINWNKEWESNFQPVVIENFCAVRAAFHHPIKNVMHENYYYAKNEFWNRSSCHYKHDD